MKTATAPSNSTTRPTWYLNPKKVSKRDYHSWSAAELKGVYTLRSKGVSPKVIPHLLKIDVKTTQINNILRILKKGSLCQCHLCGKALNKEELKQTRKFKVCVKCNTDQEAKKKERRDSLLETGRCGCCGKVKLLKGHTYCKTCISATYRARISKGVCGACGLYPIKKGSVALCIPCAEINKSKSRASRLKRALKKEV